MYRLVTVKASVLRTGNRADLTDLLNRYLFPVINFIQLYTPSLKYHLSIGK